MTKILVTACFTAAIFIGFAQKLGCTRRFVWHCNLQSHQHAGFMISDALQPIAIATIKQALTL